MLGAVMSIWVRCLLVVKLLELSLCTVVRNSHLAAVTLIKVYGVGQKLIILFGEERWGGGKTTSTILGGNRF